MGLRYVLPTARNHTTAFPAAMFYGSSEKLLAVTCHVLTSRAFLPQVYWFLRYLC